jgi:hypothetical protein
MSDLLLLIFTSLLESFGYRQLLSWWRFRGMLRRLFTGSSEWGEMRRKQFQAPAKSS